MWISTRFQTVRLPLPFNAVFDSGWNFQAVAEPFPSYRKIIENPNSYMLIPHSSRNIAHYMEVYTIVYHILHQPHRFPHVSPRIAWHVDREHLLPHDGEPEDLPLDPALQGHRALAAPPREPVRQRLPRAHDGNRAGRHALLPPPGFPVSPF